MLTLSKRTDYALLSLAYLAERPGAVRSAREIAAHFNLPLPLLAQIMKALHQRGVVRSLRGVKGGYAVQADLNCLSLQQLIQILDADDESAPPVDSVAPRGLSPLRALHCKLAAFLQDVTVADLIQPGRRIDVPLEGVRIVERPARAAALLRVLEPAGSPA